MVALARSAAISSRVKSTKPTVARVALRDQVAHGVEVVRADAPVGRGGRGHAASLSPAGAGVHAFCADAVGEDGGMSEQQQSDGPEQGETVADPRVVVVGPNGMAVEAPPGTDEVDERSVTEMVDQPAKVMRIGSMIKQLLEEVRNSELDEASRVRLKEIHTRSIKELEEGLAPELVAELERISLPFTDDSIPSESELRSPRPSWSAGSRACSTASRRRCSPSRWRPARSSRRCAAGPCRPASAASPAAPAVPAPARTQRPTSNTGQYL
jgi:hypothetical protein